MFRLCADTAWVLAQAFSSKSAPARRSWRERKSAPPKHAEFPAHEDEEQAEWLKANYKQISDATEEDGAPATMQQLRDYQATETLKSLDVSANVSESETGKLKPANTATMAAITAGITPTQPLIKVPAKGK